MKRNHTPAIITALTLLLLSSAGLAQQFPIRATAMMNPFQDHPATAGVLGCLDLHMGHRSQWAGIDGAPKTSFANLHGQMEGEGQNFHGFGGRVETDEAGAWGHTAANFSYAYNLRLSSGARLALGFSAGFFQQRLNQSLLNMPEVQGTNDPAILGSSQFVVPMLDAGIWFYDRTKYGGLTIQNVTQPSIEKISSLGKISRHVVMMAGSEIELDGQWAFLPSGQVRLAKGVPASAEILAMARFDGMAGVGIGYRTQSAFIVAAQIKVLEYLSIGYAYEMNVSPLSGAAPRTHEFVIGINGCSGMPRGKTIPCPAYN
jgi:type IX secretion system PorP/SprF family membrane protein